MTERVSALREHVIGGGELESGSLINLGDRVVRAHAKVDHDVREDEAREDVLGHRALPFGIVHAHPAWSPTDIRESIA